MTTLLEQGIEAVRTLAEERQDAAGELLLSIAVPDTDQGYPLTAAQVADVQEAVREADRGDFATDDELNALWRYCGV